MWEVVFDHSRQVVARVDWPKVGCGKHCVVDLREFRRRRGAGLTPGADQ